MALYEHIFIARPDISPQQVEGLIGMVGDTLKEHGGKICKQEYWGLKNLAYPIAKNIRGHYTLLNIEADYEALQEVERKLRLSDDVLRHMSLRVDEHEEGESIQLRHKNRDERRREDDDGEERRGDSRGDRGDRGDRRDDRGDRRDDRREGRDNRGDRPDRPEREAAPATETAKIDMGEDTPL